MATAILKNALPGLVARTTERLIDRAVTTYHRRRYRAAMLRAIDAAAEASEIWGPANRADGLRAIRALERLSGRPFDPADRVLVCVVRGQGPRHRRIRLDALAR